MSLTRQVVDAVREAILAGELEPGRLYSVVQLAEQLEVSRTPVREAMLGLADAGLVRVERNRGFRVVRPDAAHLADVFDARLLLEVPAAERAAGTADAAALAAVLGTELAAMRRAARRGDAPLLRRHDLAFHDALLRSAGNPVVADLVAGLRDTITTVGASTAGRSRTLRDIAEEHAPVLAAVERCDGAAAAAATRAHLVHTRDLLVSRLP
jgi:DNA-binding GntR family transcriptional regulator